MQCSQIAAFARLSTFSPNLRLSASTLSTQFSTRNFSRANCFHLTYLAPAANYYSRAAASACLRFYIFSQSPRRRQQFPTNISKNKCARLLHTPTRWFHHSLLWRGVDEERLTTSLNTHTYNHLMGGRAGRLTPSASRVKASAEDLMAMGIKEKLNIHSESNFFSGHRVAKNCCSQLWVL